MVSVCSLSALVKAALGRKKHVVTEDIALLEALDAVLLTPGDPEHYNTLIANNRTPYSPSARERFRAIAKRRGELHRDNHFFLVNALVGDDAPEAVGYMVDLLGDPGLSVNAIGALDLLDPSLVAGPLRAWLQTHDPSTVQAPPMLNRLRAVVDAAVPPADASAVVSVTDEMLEFWIGQPHENALRIVLAHGANVHATMGRGETMLHVAVDSWMRASDGGWAGTNRKTWESIIEVLLRVGADPERKLKRAFHSDLSWNAGTTPRAMIARARTSGSGIAQDIDFDRLEALFPPVPAAPAKRKKKSATAVAPSPDVLDRLLHGINGCADDVFEHAVRVSSVRYAQGSYIAQFIDSTTGLEDTANVRWDEPVDTKDQVAELQLAVIDAIAACCSDDE